MGPRCAASGGLGGRGPAAARQPGHGLGGLAVVQLLDYLQLGMTDAPREAEPGADAPEGPRQQPTP